MGRLRLPQSLLRCACFSIRARSDRSAAAIGAADDETRRSASSLALPTLIRLENFAIAPNSHRARPRGGGVGPPGFREERALVAKSTATTTDG